MIRVAAHTFYLYFLTIESQKWNSWVKEYKALYAS